MYSNINRQRVRYFKSHYFSWSSMTDFWLQKNLWSGKTTGQVLKNRLSEHFGSGRARANVFNFKIFGVKILGEKKKVPNFNTGRIIRNLHFPKLQWLTYISYKNSSCITYLKASRRSRRPPLIIYFLRPFLNWISFFSQQNPIAVLVIVMETINTPLCSWLQLSGDADRLNRRRLRNCPWSSTLPRLIDTLLLIKSVWIYCRIGCKVRGTSK